MSDTAIQDSWWHLSRAGNAALLLRTFVLTAPIMAVGCTWLAAGRTLPAINVAVVGLAIVCAVLPDGHAGLLVVMLIGIEWLATVDDPSTPWSLGAAVSLTLFHASMAAASVAPPAARWTRAMCRRWIRRALVAMLASAGTWAVVAVIDDRRLAGSPIVIAGALVVLAVVGLRGRGAPTSAG